MLKTNFDEEEEVLAKAFGKVDQNLKFEKGMTAKEKWKVGRLGKVILIAMSPSL